MAKAKKALKRVDNGAGSAAAIAADMATHPSLAIFRRGIRTSTDYGQAFSDMMGGVAVGVVPPQVCAALCNAGGKLLKVKELEQRYGTPAPGPGGPSAGKVLQLV